MSVCQDVPSPVLPSLCCIAGLCSFFTLEVDVCGSLGGVLMPLLGEGPFATLSHCDELLPWPHPGAVVVAVTD
jgi:hypothetical protein